MKISEDVFINKVDRLCNMLEISGVILVVFLAFVFQIVFRELPCPLCLLQRLGFFGMALGFLLNLRFGFRPSHYAVVILSAVYTSLVALRQIALHVVPGTGSYGDPVFGLHLYTWSFIVAMMVLVTTSLIMSVDQQYRYTQKKSRPVNWIVNILFATVVLLAVLNVGTILMQCGLKDCPENPTFTESLLGIVSGSR